MKKPASCGLREARDQHLDHPRAQQCVRPAQSVLYEEDQHCGQRSSNTHPASAHQSGCLTPPSFSEALLLLATTPKRHPGYRCHLMTSSCLVFSQDPSESPHVTRLCCFGPGHDLSRWQFPVLPPHKERLHLGLRGRRSWMLLRRGLSVRKLEARLSRQHRTLRCLQLAGLGRWILSSQGFPQQEAEQWP